MLSPFVLVAIGILATASARVSWLTVRVIGLGLELVITLPWLAVQFLRFLRFRPTALACRLAGSAVKRVLDTDALSGRGLDLTIERLE